MEREGSTSFQDVRTAGHGTTGKSAYLAYWPFNGRLTVVAVASMAFLAIVAIGATREQTATGGATKAAMTRSPTNPPKPAYTRAEEAYIRALWPVHGDVERSTLRVSLGKIFYKTDDLSAADLKTRIDAAMATYQSAEERINALQAPPSMARSRDDYLTAVQLFKQSAAESLKMFEDGNDEHLLAAYPLGHEGSTKIRAVGARFWQDEFPPN